MQSSDGARRTRRLHVPRRWSLRLATAGAALAVLAVPAAWASDRFADVPNSNPHHDDINTIARAGITLGCNPPTNTLYCPGDSVTRQQMGSFLARTLRAVTPVYGTATSSGALDPDTSPIACQTGPNAFPIQTRALVWGQVALRQASAGELGYSVQPVFSTDGGATWSGAPSIISYATSVTSGAWSNASQVLLLGAGPAPPDTRLGMRVARESGTVDASDSLCRIVAQFSYRDAGPAPWGPMS
jgi:hypothetical protein